MTEGSPTTIMALDVGGRRIGVALASSVARLAQPFKTLENSTGIFEDIVRLAKEQNVSVIVVGRPRGLSGQTTEQTEVTEAFAAKLKKHSAIEIHLQDEAVTSAQAEAELKAKGQSFAKADVDALAATYILEDYMHDHMEANRV